MVVVERMCDLVHDKVRVLEEAQDPIIEFNTNVITILFHTKRTKNKVLHPVVIDLLDYRCEVLGLDDLAELDPCGPQKRELVD